MDKQKCACRGDFLDKFLQPAVLAALYDAPMHGFSLIKTLTEGSLILGGELDPTGLYRTLKRMEQAGLLASYYEEGSPTQTRRVYQITQQGRECLTTWGSTLAAYRNCLDALIYQVSLKTGPAETCPCNGAPASVQNTTETPQ